MRRRTDGPTQIERLLAVLRARAAAGRSVNTIDFLAPAVDGGAPILRLPARVNDLRNTGFLIETRRALNGTADYRLIDEPAPATAEQMLEARPLAVERQPHLFPLGLPQECV
jgi:hypothetical protein